MNLLRYIQICTARYSQRWCNYRSNSLTILIENHFLLSLRSYTLIQFKIITFNEEIDDYMKSLALRLV
jgi:hypothetical protein